MMCELGRTCKLDRGHCLQERRAKCELDRMEFAWALVEEVAEVGGGSVGGGDGEIHMR